MNLKNLVRNLGLLLALLFFTVGVTSAQIYVSATNGDDNFGTGAQGTPYRTIQKAIDVAATGSTINVEAGVYNNVQLPGPPAEGNPITVNTAKSLTLIGTAKDVNTTVMLTNGLTINNANAVVTLGPSGTAAFNLGTTASALVLTAGTLNVPNPANVVIGSGATITVTNGTLSAAPTTGANLNVVFNGTDAIGSTAAFLPSSLGNGTLTINKASGAITIDNAALSLTTLSLSNAASATIAGNLTVAADGNVNHAGTGTLTIGSSSANVLTMTSVAGLSQIAVSGGGSVVINAAVTYNVTNGQAGTVAGDGAARAIGNVFAVSAASNLTANGNITFNNTNVASSDGKNAVAHNVILSNSGTGTVSIVGSILTPLSSVAFSAPTGGSSKAYVTVILSNTSTGAFNVRSAALRGATATNGVINNAGGSMTLGQSGDVFSTGFDVVNDGATAVMTINGAATLGGTVSNGNAASQIIMGDNVSVAGALTNAGKIKLNSNTLTLSGTGAAMLIGAGEIYSSTSGATGSGLVKFTGDAPTSTFTGALPNVEIASKTSMALAGNTIWGNLVTSGAGAIAIGGVTDVKGSVNLNGSGLLTINGATTVRGDVNMTSASITMGAAGLTVEGTMNMPQGTFTFGANTLTLKGNFNRTGGTIDAAAAGTGKLTFAGTKSQSFTPGTQMNVYNVEVLNTGNYLAGVVADDIVTISASLIVRNDFTITTGQVALGTSNIRMTQTANSARFTNGGRGYSANGIGGIIFEGTGNNPAGAGDGAVITGAQPFSNIYVRLSNTANNVLVLGAVKISGVITLDGGGIAWNAATDGDAFTASTLTLDDALVVPTVVINTQNAHGQPFLVDGADGGAVPLAITSVYNLSYTGQTARTIGATDFVTGKVQNLSIIAGTAAKTITFIAGNGAIKGNLSIDAGETLDLTNGVARTLTASGNSAVHAVNGSIVNGTFEITGTGAQLNGGVGTGNASSVATLVVDPATGGTFTSNSMKVLGDLTINQAALVSTINMNSATATVNTFTNTTGTTNLNMNSTAVTAGANYLVTAGNVTLTMNGAAAATRTIGGTLTVNGGSLTLGSSINVTGAVSQAGSGSLILGNNNLTLASTYTHNGTGTITAGTGAVVAATGVAATAYTFTTAVDIPNFTLNAPGFGIQFVTNGLKVTNAFVHTAGDLDVNSLPLTITGNTYTFTAGSYANTGNAATGKVSLQGAALVVTAAANPTFQNLEVNSAGIVTFATNDNATPTARNFTAASSFTHTKGNIALGINDLTLTGAASYTTAATAGSVTGDTGAILGEVVFNGGGAQQIVPAENYSIQNLKILAATSKPAANEKVLTVSDNFTLGANFTYSNSARLVLGNGATVTRSAGVFDQVPTFGTTVNVVLNPVGALNTDKEIPVANNVLNNLTIASGTPTLTANVTVNGTLYLKGGNLNCGAAPVKILTIANGATIDRSGGSFLTPGDGNVPTVSSYKLVYSGNAAIAGIGAEFSNAADAVSNLTVSMTGAGVLLNADRTVGSFTMSPTGNGAAAVYFAVGTDAATRTFTVNGPTVINNGVISTQDVTAATSTDASSFVVKGSLAVNGGSFGNLGDDDGDTNIDGGLNVTFGGAAAQDVTLAGNITLPNITLNSAGATAAASTVNVSGGNLTITNLVTFVNGILNMKDGKSLILARPSVAANLGLGYDRSAVVAGKFGHVVGKVQRFAQSNDGSAGTNGRFEFPVGTLSGEYRPAVINFTPSYTVGSPVNLTVSHVDTDPEGTSLPSGVGDYPKYYWLVSTSPSSLAPTQKFDVEFSATKTGYPFGKVEDLKIIRRQDGQADSNPWVIQGDAASYANYNVVAGTDTTGIIRTTSSIGGLIAQGSRYAIGLPGSPEFSITGTVKYDNAAGSNMNAVTVSATPVAGGAALTATTNAQGVYTIANVPAGQYTVSATSSAAWLPTSATDALLIAKQYAGTSPLAGLKLVAADVNASNSVNNTDALLVLKRSTNASVVFAKGNWVFSSEAVTITNADATVNLKGLSTGDVNASGMGTTAKATVQVSNNSKLSLSKKNAINLPVKVGADMNVGAMTLTFKYPADLVSFEGIASKADNIQVNDDQKGNVVLAWADLSGKAGIDLKSGDALVTLQFKSKNELKAGNKIDVELNGQASELANSLGEVLAGATLDVASLEVAKPTQFTLSNNYPNPFNPTTTIRYELPVNARVNLVVYNTLGEQVATLVNGQQEVGQYEVNFNASNLTSGVYFYRLTVTGEGQNFTQTHKMMLMK